MASRTALIDAVLQRHLDLAWGWWTELGVPGSREQVITTAIHPEALLVFSAPLITHDARLREGVIGWVLANQRHIGTRQVLAVADRLPAPRDAMATFSATLAAAGGPRFPGHAEGAPLEGSVAALQRPLRLDRPGMSLLRLRLALGHHARSEVLAVLAGGDARARTHGELTRFIASTPRNVRLALDDLISAGVVLAVREPGPRRYRCTHPDRLRDWIGPLPEMPPWVTLLPAVTTLRLALTRSGDEMERAVQARIVVDHQGDHLSWMNLPELPRTGGRDQARALAEWLLDACEVIAQGVGEASA